MGLENSGGSPVQAGEILRGAQKTVRTTLPHLRKDFMNCFLLLKADGKTK